VPNRLVGRGSEERCRAARVGMVDYLILWIYVGYKLHFKRKYDADNVHFCAVYAFSA
jgi:hypothetical protein